MTTRRPSPTRRPALGALLALAALAPAALAQAPEEPQVQRPLPGLENQGPAQLRRGPVRAPEPPPAPPDDPGILAEASVGEPVVAGNVAVYPLLAKRADEAASWRSLDEALDAKALVIEEQGESGSVNELHVTNRGSEPVFLLAGEVLLGGKQDRIVGRNTLVPVGAKGLPVAVYCVEQGRWKRETASFGSAKTLAHAKLRQQTSKESQAEVWSEVRATNAKRGTANATDTYRAAARKAASQAEVRRAVRALAAGTRGDARVAGIVVAVDGELRAVDWFAAPRLYRKLEEKLLASYVTEALDAGDGKAHAAPPRAAAEAFVKQAEAAQATAERSGGDGKVYLFGDDAVEGQGIYVQPAAGKAKALQKSYYAK